MHLCFDHIYEAFARFCRSFGETSLTLWVDVKPWEGGRSLRGSLGTALGLEAQADVVFHPGRPCFAASFDRIVVDDLFALPPFAGRFIPLLSCLRPGGSLYTASLGFGSFHEWRHEGVLTELGPFVGFAGDLCAPGALRAVQELWFHFPAPQPLARLSFLREKVFAKRMAPSLFEAALPVMEALPLTLHVFLARFSLETEE